MCVMAVGAIVSVLQSVVSFAAAQADYEAKAAQWTQNYKNALASGRDEQKQIGLRMIQEEVALTQKTQANTVEGAKALGQAEAAAGAAGVAGISLDNLKGGIERQIADKMAADNTNYRYTVAQLTTEMDATNTNIENRINSVQKPVPPNPLGYVLSGIGGALKAAA